MSLLTVTVNAGVQCNVGLVVNLPESQIEPPRLRDWTRAAVRAEIADRALQLFDEYGFDATTVDNIAAVAGISARTFFRYFATKEDVVFGDLVPIGESIRSTLVGRPTGESAWAALRAAVHVIADIADAENETALRVTRVASSTASLRARSHEKHAAWASLLTPLIEARLVGPDDPRLAAEALVYSALACLDIALNEWARSDGKRNLRHLIDIAFDGVEQHVVTPGRADA